MQPTRLRPLGRAQRGVRLACAVAVGAALLAGCSGLRSPAPATSTTTAGATSSPTAVPTPAELAVPDGLERTVKAVLTDGALTTGESTFGEGAIQVVATFATRDAILALPAPEGARWEVQTDRSAVLVEDARPEVGGLAPPTAKDAAGTPVGTLVEGDGERLEVRLRARGTAQLPVTVTLDVAPSALERAVWAERLEGGRSLQVFPTAFGRSGSGAALEAVRQALVATEPEAGTSVMDKQLRCHALGAPTKESWNLEPWRPDVDYLDYLLARCNPAD
ncbi:DUF2599 domain-containing protein [Sanguibacter hominis ATCC BAA-789]|uniref:DUF2599 domain-containing protein n=1 Tax=Sanguibacter hominis ATCC BAA-789 TaxID=1312740 RepID=A0A9X5ISC6_9MICO|nr:DUF2599 domain-containing protein [Sanguibacter hominis ATCC BAA-789]